MEVIAWIGVATALLGALIALRQDDIKKILAYSTVSQLGYMFVGVGVGAFREGIFHLVTHAFFKGLLFLAAGSVMHAMANRTDVWGMGGLRKAMPITFWTSAVGWLAIAGVFPFAGFFSKDQILTEAYIHGYCGIWLLGLLGAVLTAFYMSRWFFLIFLGGPRFGGDVHPHESPAVDDGAADRARGAVSRSAARAQLRAPRPAVQLPRPRPSPTSPASATRPPAASPSSASSAPRWSPRLVGIGLAYLAYVRGDLTAGRMLEPIRGLPAELLERKFYVDELYRLVFIRIGGSVRRRHGVGRHARRRRCSSTAQAPRRSPSGALTPARADGTRPRLRREPPARDAGAGRVRPVSGEVGDGIRLRSP